MVSSPPKPLGEWKIADGTPMSQSVIAALDLCGFVSWAKESAAPLGREVLIDMKPNGHSWFGTAVMSSTASNIPPICRSMAPPLSRSRDA